MRFQLDGPVPSPVYRFWGAKPPQARVPIVDAAPGTDAGSSTVAVLRLYEPLDSMGGDWGVSAKEFAAALAVLPADVDEIQLHINSPGGEVFEGIAVMNLLRAHPARVTAIVEGIAASAASFIAASADTTVVAPNSEMMIHDASGLVLGNAADMYKMAGILDHLSDNIASVYAAKSGGSTAFWRDAMRTETWYSAQEAVTAGLADRLDVKAPVQPSDRFDLSMFGHAGRAAAPAPQLPGTPEPSAPSDPPATTGPSRELDARHRLTARRLRLPV